MDGKWVYYTLWMEQYDLFICRAYPRLKDAQLDASKYPVLYYQLIKNVRTMYQVCKLVHADLSEYNILYVYTTVIPI